MNTVTAHRADGEVFAARAEAPPSGFSLDRVVDSLKSVASLSEALRILGAGVLIASMSVFLLQGWDEGNDIKRYLLLLAQTGLLAAGGLVLAYGLRETKGARVFFGLALISIPANFTILGALVYSVVQLDGMLATYPEFATWQLGDIANLGMTMAGALIVLLPVTLFCFAIMARHSAKLLTLHFAVLNLILLVPVRSSVIAGALGLTGALYAAWAVHRLVAKDKALRTPEGRFALTALFLPIGIVLFRSMYFYEVSSLLLAMLAAAVFVALRQASVFPDRSKLVSGLLDAASLPVAALGAVSLAAATSGSMPDEFVGPLGALVYAGFAVDVMRRTASSIVSGFASVTTSLAVMFAFAFSVIVAESALTALLAVAAGTGLTLAGLWFKERSAAVAGILTIAIAAWFGFGSVLEMVLTSSWISLAIFGASAIALGSLVERHGVAIKLRVVRWTERRREPEGVVLDD